MNDDHVRPETYGQMERRLKRELAAQRSQAMIRPRTGVFNATESEKRDAFEWLRARALAGERRAGIMFEELAAAQAAFRTIEQALLPDPQDERELSVEWLRKVIHAAIDEARKPWVLWDN